MKNKKIFILLITLIILSTGCSKKSLACTSSNKNNGISVNQKITFNFYNNKIKKVYYNVDTIGQSKNIKNNWDMIANELDNKYNQYQNDNPNLKLSTNNKTNKYTYNLSIFINLDNVTSDELKDLQLSSLSNNKVKMEDVKKDFQKNGYKCK